MHDVERFRLTKKKPSDYIARILSANELKRAQIMLGPEYTTLNIFGPEVTVLNNSS